MGMIFLDSCVAHWLSGLSGRPIQDDSSFRRNFRLKHIECSYISYLFPTCESSFIRKAVKAHVLGDTGSTIGFAFQKEVRCQGFHDI